jgi:hypothetical protein
MAASSQDSIVFARDAKPLCYLPIDGAGCAGRPMNGHTLTRTYQSALQAAGVRKVRFHDLRHTFGTRMAAAGVPMRTLQEWMGHRDFRTTLIYADYAPGAHEVDLVNGAFSPTDPAEVSRGLMLRGSRDDGWQEMSVRPATDLA